MTRCKELVGKVVESFSLYEDGPYGPEILIEFTDGTLFSSRLKTSSLLEAKLLEKRGSESEILTDLLHD